MPRDDLRSAKAAVERAVAEQRRPPTEDEGVKAVLPVVVYVDDNAQDMKALWRVVSLLRRHEPHVYNRFVGEGVLRNLIVDVIVDIHIERKEQLDLHRLVTELNRIADERSRWLVAVPLTNVLPPKPYVELDEGAAIGMTIQEKDRGRESPRPFSGFSMFHHLHDHLTHDVRWWPSDSRRGALDTRRTAIIYLIEDGTQTAAATVARSRARMVLALWCLMSRPNGEELWPSIGDWLPRPYVNEAMDHKLYEPDEWMSKERVQGRSSIEYREYGLPDDEDLLRSAVRFTRKTPGCLSARAITSAAWSLHVAEREPNDLERTDQLLHLVRAIQALCDTGQPDDAASKRWAGLTERLGVWRGLRASYEQKELEEVKRLAHNLRDLAAHSSDDVLVNLGYPAAASRELTRQRLLTGDQLALARSVAAVPVLRHAVREVTLQLAKDAIDHDFDEAWWLSTLAVPSRRRTPNWRRFLRSFAPTWRRLRSR